MVTLYYSPGACSQAPHILMHEIGIDHDAVRVHLKSHTLNDGSSYLAVHPKGSVPAIQIENGEVLTENAVILQYLADRAGADQVLPPLGDFRRYRVLEMVNFITTELHKSFSPLFAADAGDEVKAFFSNKVANRLDYIDARLGSGPFLFGEMLTLPDPYLFVISGWAEALFGLEQWPNLAAFRARMLQRPWVRHVLRFEGLLKEVAAS
jgi:glutathione S-transferase